MKIKCTLKFNNKDDKIYYYVCESKILPVKVERCIIENPKAPYPYFRFIDENGKFDSGTTSANWHWIHNTKEEAEARANHINGLAKQFRHTPYIPVKILEKEFFKLYWCENEIDKRLQSNPGYDGVYFVDMGGHGIEARAMHKELNGYCICSPVYINYDFSNIKEVPDMVAKSFIEATKQDNLKTFKEFIRESEKWGWD